MAVAFRFSVFALADAYPGWMDPLWICRLPVTPYGEALALQEAVRAGRLAGELPDVLLLLEHEPVYTRGRRSEPGELPFGETWYRERGIEIVATDRGGRLTYHGPGQLVGYPIMAIGDVVAYLRTMETAMIGALHEIGVAGAGVREGLTGVWVEDRKIGSIGVHVSRGITTHGFAINVNNDLEPFSWVVPCGLEGVRMTSVAAELGAADGEPLGDRFRELIAVYFARCFEREPQDVARERLAVAGVLS